MANTYITDTADFIGTEGNTEHKTFSVAGLFKAFFQRLARSCQEANDAAIAEFIESRGGQLTDDLERQISRRFGNHAGQY